MFSHGELVLVVGDLLDLGPGEADLWAQLVAGVVKVDGQCVNAQEDLMFPEKIIICFFKKLI